LASSSTVIENAKHAWLRDAGGNIQASFYVTGSLAAAEIAAAL
jgi:hypothetical protein